MLKDYPIPQKYISSLNKIEENIIKSEIAEKGIEKTLSDLFIQIDCTRKTKKGFNFVQTIDHKYRAFQAYIYFIYSNYTLYFNDEYKNKLRSIHERNLEYEKENKPKIYKNEKINKEISKNVR